MEAKDQIIIDGVTYYKEKQELVLSEIKDAGVASAMIGKNVIVRSRNEGINCGTVVQADKTGVILKDVRRLWYLKPSSKNLSWYEGVAVSGLSKDSKVSGTVDMKVIIEDYSMTLVSEKAYKSIMGAKCVGS